MCSLCGAFVLMKGKTLEVVSAITGIRYILAGSAQDAEKAPYKYRLSKNGEGEKEFISSVDSLATIVSRGGFDLKNDDRTVKQDEWIEAHFD